MDRLHLIRVNLVTFFATHPSLLYTHPYTFCILDSCSPPHGFHSSPVFFPNPFLPKKFSISAPPPSCLWSLIFRNPWQQWFLSFHWILFPPFPLSCPLFTQRFLPVHGSISYPEGIPTSPGSDAIPYPLTIVSLSHDGDAGVLVLGASLHYSSAYGSIPDTHLTAQWVP